MPSNARQTKNATLHLFAERLRRNGNGPKEGEAYGRGDACIHFDRAERFYEQWSAPTCIIADGPYGISGFPGDEKNWASLAEWYEHACQGLVGAN